MNHHKINLAPLSFLIIDDSPTMRASLRMTASTFGVTKIDIVASAVEAFNRMTAREYDVILCDYNLGDSKDGQMLLEETQRRGLLKPSTIFVMVTAERSYERVVSAVELAPDDYLLKPFTGEMLQRRLEKIACKKKLLKPVHDLLAKGEAAQAAALCLSLAERTPGMMVDFLRLGGETLLRMGSFSQALTTYQKIMDQKPFPWARLGHARALQGLERLQESADELEDLVGEHPDFISAYDWLAKAYQALGDDIKAKEALQRAVLKTPRTITRQQELGHVAYQAEDLDTAEKALSSALDLGKHSELLAPKDYAGLAHVLADKGEFGRAVQVLDGAAKTLKETTEGQVHAALARSVIAARTGDAAAASKLFQEAHSLARSGEVDEHLQLSLVRAAFESGNEETGKALVQDLVRSHHHNVNLLGRVEKTLGRAGQGEIGAELVQAAKREVIQVNNRAVKLAQIGDLKGAMELLITAADDIPNNNVVVLNAAKAILAWMTREGWDEDKGRRAHSYLRAIQARSPTDAKMLATLAGLKEIALKFGAPLAG